MGYTECGVDQSVLIDFSLHGLCSLVLPLVEVSATKQSFRRTGGGEKKSPDPISQEGNQTERVMDWVSVRAWLMPSPLPPPPALSISSGVPVLHGKKTCPDLARFELFLSISRTAGESLAEMGSARMREAPW